MLKYIAIRSDLPILRLLWRHPSDFTQILGVLRARVFLAVQKEFGMQRLRLRRLAHDKILVAPFNGGTTLLKSRTAPIVLPHASGPQHRKALSKVASEKQTKRAVISSYMFGVQRAVLRPPTRALRRPRRPKEGG